MFQKVFGYGYKNIPYINRLKNKVFIGLTFIILILNMFLAFSLNMKKASDDFLFNNYVIIDLKNNLPEENINNLEKEIYELNGVNSVRYMDKSESFRNLQNDLNISIPESTNPLADSMVVHLKDKMYIGQIQELLENRENVKEVYLNNDYIDISEKEGLTYILIQISALIVTLLLGIIAIIIFNLEVSIEFLNSVNADLNFKRNLKNCKIRNLLSFSAATIVGTLIFFNFYILFIKYISVPIGKFIVLSFWQISLYHIVAILFLNFLVWIIPMNIFKISRGEEE